MSRRMRRQPRTPKPELMTQAEGEALAQHIFRLMGDEPCTVYVSSSVTATTNAARGDAHLVTEKGGVFVQIVVKGCTVGTSQLDDAGLKAAIAEARAVARDIRAADAPFDISGPKTFGPRPQTFFESNPTAMAPEARAELFSRTLDATEAAGLIGAGELTFRNYAGLTMSSGGLVVYGRESYGELSLTARTQDGTGCGWGWSGHEDWSRVNPEAVVTQAIDLAQRSAKPVVVEPGRYTVILEPSATASLLDGINWSAFWADQGTTPFSKEPLGTNKIGLQMLDRRLGMVSDPWDSEMPRDTVDYGGDPVEKVVWFDRGVLKDLYYDARYAEAKHRAANAPSSGVRLFGEGPTETLEEMIASTKRGIWVNRLSGVAVMNGRTDLRTGTTRDGTFLIENGKPTRAIKNFRFTESPFFVLNKLEAFGEPVRASQKVVAPRLKVRDFNFTSLTDAI